MSTTDRGSQKDLSTTTHSGAGATVPNVEAVDGSKVNDLLDFVRQHLESDFHGGFRIKGQSSGGLQRQTQLNEVYELKKALEEMKNTMEKQNEIATADFTKDAKKTSKAGSNIVATIKNVVQEHLSDKLRDLIIRTERTEECLKKECLKKSDVDTKALEAKDEALERRIKALENSVKKPESQLQSQLKALDAKIQAMEPRMSQAEKANAKSESVAKGLLDEHEKLAAKIADINRQQAGYASSTAMKSLEQSVDSSAAALQILEDDVKESNTAIRGLQQNVQEASTEANRLSDQMRKDNKLHKARVKELGEIQDAKRLHSNRDLKDFALDEDNLVKDWARERFLRRRGS